MSIFFRLLDDGLRPILIINLTGAALTSVLGSTFAVRCWQVVIRVKRRFFNSGVAAIADWL